MFCPRSCLRCKGWSRHNRKGSRSSLRLLCLRLLCLRLLCLRLLCLRLPSQRLPPERLPFQQRHQRRQLLPIHLSFLRLQLRYPRTLR